MKPTASFIAAILAGSETFVHAFMPHEHRHGHKALGRRADNTTYAYPQNVSYTPSTQVSGVPIFGTHDPVEVATRFIYWKSPKAQFRVVDDFFTSSNGITHVHFKQTANGIDIDNADYTVNVKKDASIFSFGGSIFWGTIPAADAVSRKQFRSPLDALRNTVGKLGLPINHSGATEAEVGNLTYKLPGTTGTQRDPSAKLVYFQKPNGELALTWRVETDILDEWLITYSNAVGGGEILGVSDYVSHADYNVYPWGTFDPTRGTREIKSDPYDPVASEFSWQSDGTTKYIDTRGNNGIAQANLNADNDPSDDPRPVSPNLDFDYPYNISALDPHEYLNASVTQLWYIANTFHDLLYHLGFTPAAGNFEANNNGEGGKGGDAVTLNAQDGAGVNNANFATPPDGTPPRMRMYIFTLTSPPRDGVFDTAIPIHEYTHGLSNRLTGGAANTNCLDPVAESAGMGEGWSDFFALTTLIKITDNRTLDFPMGPWTGNRTTGIRLYIYSTNTTTNPLTFESANGMTEVHRIGTVWCTFLYEILWNLIESRGNTAADTPTFDSQGVPTDGRYLALKLALDGMALQPCRPNFIQARDAILDADIALTGGKNLCALWRGFAKRGLGEGATLSTSDVRTNSFKIPTQACPGQ